MIKKIQYKFEDFDQVHEAEEWELESRIEETRSELGIPIWTETKILEENIIQEDEPRDDLKIISSSTELVSHNQPKPVPKRTRKVKDKQEAMELPVPKHVHGHSDPLIS